VENQGQTLGRRTSHAARSAAMHGYGYPGTRGFGGNKMCEFCEVGVYNRRLMWRLVKDMSRSTLREKLKEGDQNFMENKQTNGGEI